MRSLPLLAMLLVGCGMKYDPKNATFYAHRSFLGPVGKAPPRAAVTCNEWRTIERDGPAFLDRVERSAQGVVVTSRMNGALELSGGATRLRMTPLPSEVLFECCETEEGSCRSLLATALEKS